VQEGEEGKGTKGSERVVGKVVGDKRVFISGSGPGWQMRSGSDAMPGGEGGHGVAKPDRVIHRLHF
jgi:hypothetical protein